LQDYDYSQPRIYFVTICTEHRSMLFGEVIRGAMVTNEKGDMIYIVWEALSESFPGIALDAMIVMPDHVHGVIVLGADPEVGTLYRLGDVVKYFKGRSTSRYIANVTSLGWPRFEGRLWQRRYFDRVVRSDRELSNIHEYIETNPYRWEQRTPGNP
jgi:REP element-mobilizing transposase RayT